MKFKKTRKKEKKIGKNGEKLKIKVCEERKREGKFIGSRIEVEGER